MFCAVVLECVASAEIYFVPFPGLWNNLGFDVVVVHHQSEK